VGGLTAAKLIGQTGGASRLVATASSTLRSTGWPSPSRVAIQQFGALLQHRGAAGNTKSEALRVLRRHLADVIDAATCAAEQAANAKQAGQPAAA
jgi:hypothetical protein